MPVWVVRAGSGGEMEDVKFEQNLVTISWKEVPDISGLKSLEEVKRLCQKVYPDHTPGSIASHARQIWDFYTTIQKGDLVLLPRKKPGGRGMVAVGRVTGPYQYRADLPPDAHYTHRAEWLTKNLPRTSFDEDLLIALNSRTTVTLIKNERTEERILALVGAHISAHSSSAHNQEVESTLEPKAGLDIQQYARDQIHNHIRRVFRGPDLARLVNGVLLAQGFQTHISPPRPDGIVDILAGKGAYGLDQPRLCVQVQSKGQKGDARTLSELQSVMSSFEAQQGVLVSWDGFEQPVLTEARQHASELRLWDADQFIDALLEHHEQLSPELQTELPLKRIWTLVLEDPEA